jgi:hypothetical protein
MDDVSILSTALVHYLLTILLVEVASRQLPHICYKIMVSMVYYAGSGRLLIFLSLLVSRCRAFVPFLDGGKEMPALYNGWLNGQIAKQVRMWKKISFLLGLCGFQSELLGFERSGK